MTCMYPPDVLCASYILGTKNKLWIIGGLIPYNAYFQTRKCNDLLVTIPALHDYNIERIRLRWL